MSDKSVEVIYDFLSVHASLKGDKLAAIEGDINLTYAALKQKVDRLATALLAHGIQPGDRVATLAPPGLEFWMTYHATVSIGAIWMGLNPVYREHEFEYLLSDATPALIFSRSDFDDRNYTQELFNISQAPHYVSLDIDQSGAEHLDRFLAKEVNVNELVSRRSQVSSNDTAVIVYTSGTTGHPKGAMLSHGAIVKLAIENARWMGDDLESTIMSAVINHIGGLNNICMNVLAHGGKIIFFNRVDIEALAAIREQEHPTYLVSSPTGFMMLMESTDWQQRAGATKLIVTGGAATPINILEAWHPYCDRIVSVYGQTETTGIVTRTDDNAALEEVAETIGKPLPGAEFKTIRADGSTCNIDEPGELVMAGPYCMNGYYNKPQATKEAFTEDGYLRTGDIAYLREDGNYVFVGRIKEMFKSGGYNVYPLEIEQAICEHPDVLLAAVFAVPDERFQEVGHAYVMPIPGKTVSEADVKSLLKEKMANYKVPKTFSVEETLPLLPNGKVDKQQLKSRL